jgi:hypothetical protein
MKIRAIGMPREGVENYGESVMLVTSMQSAMWDHVNQGAWCFTPSWRVSCTKTEQALFGVRLNRWRA